MTQGIKHKQVRNCSANCKTKQNKKKCFLKKKSKKKKAMYYNYNKPDTENRTFWDMADLNMRQKMGLTFHFCCSRQLTQSIFLQYIFQSASLE